MLTVCPLSRRRIRCWRDRSTCLGNFPPTVRLLQHCRFYPAATHHAHQKSGLTTSCDTIQLILLAPVVYAACTGFAKLSLLILYRRLSPQKWFIWAADVSIFVVAGYSIGIFFSLIFACSPVSKSWDTMMTTGSCINRPALYVTTAALGVATDVVLIVLPIRIVVGLQMRLLQKAGLIFMFAIGSA